MSNCNHVKKTDVSMQKFAVNQGLTIYCYQQSLKNYTESSQNRSSVWILDFDKNLKNISAVMQCDAQGCRSGVGSTFERK